MTIQMPGPPECAPDGSPHESVPYNGGDFLRCHRHDPTRRYRKSKRLTMEGCAAEYWRATSVLALALYAPAEVLGVDTPSDGHMYRWERPDYEPLNREHDTWQRFMDTPHALEES